MSVDTSLLDTPGVSVYFDGKPIQDEQEAELLREDERHARELQRAIATELEEFEDDFYSESDEDSGEESRNTTSQLSRNVSHSEAEVSPVFAKLPRHPQTSPLSRARWKSHSIPEGLHENYNQLAPFHHQNGGKRLEEMQNGLGGDHSLRASTDNLSGLHALAHNTGLPSRAKQAESDHHLISTQNPPNLYSNPNVSDYDGQDSFEVLDKNRRRLEPHFDSDLIDPAKQNVVHPYGYQYSNVHNRQGQNEDTHGDSDVSGYLSLTDQQNLKENVNPSTKAPYSNDYRFVTYDHVGSGAHIKRPDQSEPSDLRQEYLYTKNSSTDYNFPEPTGQLGDSGKTNHVFHAGDEWMLQIKAPTTASHPYQPSIQQQNLVEGQSLDSNPAFNLHHSNQQASTPADLGETNGGHTFMRAADTFNRPFLQQQFQKGAPAPALPLTPPPSLPTSAQLQKPTENNPQIPDASKDPYSQYKVIYNKKDEHKGEEQFYLNSDHIEFFQKDLPEERRTYEQLTILYKARGREIEQLTRKLEDKENEMGKDIRALKHKLAIATGEAEGASESLRHCQTLLQQTKSDCAEANGKIRALESQVSSVKEAKEELLKKLQTSESTIENMAHHIDELESSESLSRARNEHEAVISSLTQRYERELLGIKERLDATKAALESKQEEVVYLKKQLADTTQELERAQISRGETINKLAKSLEDSQRQCQALLEQSTCQEMSSLKAQLQQSLASKRLSDDLCSSFQKEIKDLKEQLNIFESASSLGVFSTSTMGGRMQASHDDSMTDLGIRKTLDFNTPPSAPSSNNRTDTGKPHDELIASLRSELERCIRSNKQKRNELAERTEEVKSLREELESTQRKVTDLDRMCGEQKKRLQEIDSLTSGTDGVGIVEARLKRELENLKREKTLLLEDIEDYKKRLEEVGSSESRLTEINTELSQQMAQMVNDFDSDKHASLDRCQRTLEEVHRLTVENLRAEMEERHRSEKSMLADRYTSELKTLKHELDSTLSELDSVKSLYSKLCEESGSLELELADRYKKQLEEELQKLKSQYEPDDKSLEDRLQEELKKRGEMEQRVLKDAMEAELRTAFEKDTELKVLRVRLECQEECGSKMQALMEETVAHAKEQWTASSQKEKDHLTEEMSELETVVTLRDQEINELKQKLSEALSKMEEGRQSEAELQAKVDSLAKSEAELQAKVDSLAKSEAELQAKVDSLAKRHEDYVKSVKEGSQVEKERFKEQMKEKLSIDEMKSETNTLFINHGSKGPQSLEQPLPTRSSLDFNQVSAWSQESVAEEVGGVKEQLKETDNIECLGLTANRSDMNLASAARTEDTPGMNLTFDSVLLHKLAGLSESDFDSSSFIKLGVMNFSVDDVADVDKLSSSQIKDLLKKLKGCVQNLELQLKSTKQNYEIEIEDLRQKHKIEFEKSARAREEKFQSELRYFLKEREDRGRARLEEAVAQCEVKARAELQKADAQHKVHMMQVIASWEEKSKTEQRRAVEDCEKRVREEMSLEGKGGGGHESMEELRKKVEIEKELKDRKEKELVILRSELEKERRDLESKLESKRMELEDCLKRLGREKKELEDKLMKLENERKELNDAMKRVVEEKEDCLKRIGSEKTELEENLMKLENERKELKDDMKRAVEEKEEEILALSLRHEQEEKSRKREFEEIVHKLQLEQLKEIEKLTKEKEEIKFSTAAKRNLLNTLDREKDVEKVVAERVSSEVSKMKESFKLDEIEKEVCKRMQEQRVKWLEEAREYITGEIKQGIEDRLAEEREKANRENGKEAEERNSDLEVDKRVKEKLEFEMTNLKKKFVSELDARVIKEKARLEEEVTVWKEKAKRKMEEERAVFEGRTAAELEAKISDEKKATEEVKRNMLREIEAMRDELESDMRERIKQERKDWEEEREREERRRENNGAGWHERLKSEVDAKTKACQERDKAVEFIKALEAKHREEKQRLCNGLNKCTEDLDAVRKEHAMLEEKFSVLDHKYKSDMSEAKTRRKMDLSELREKLDTEKDQAVSSLKNQLQDVKDQYQAALDTLQDQMMAEREHGFSGRYRTDSNDEKMMSLVSEANLHAAAELKAEALKQRVYVVEVMRAKFKSTLRSVLSGQVKTSCITLLEESLDAFAQELITAHSVLSTPQSRPTSGDKEIGAPASEKQSHQAAHEPTRQSPVIRNPTSSGSSPHNDRAQRSGQRDTGQQNFKGSGDDLQPVRLTPQALPNLDKVQFDDTFYHTPTNSNNSSPASLTRTKSRTQPPAARQHVLLPDPPSLSAQASRPKAPNDSTESDIAEQSPREAMKMMEARVKLANWAQTGEMPWKSSREEVANNQLSSYTSLQDVHRRQDRQAAKRSDGNKAPQGSAENGSRRTAPGNGYDSNKVDSDGFVRPGVEAEKWLRSNKVSKVGGQNTPGTKRDQDYSGTHWGREDDSASSADSNVSFHTLDFEETTDQYSERDAYGHTPCNVKSGHGKNPRPALAEERKGDSHRAGHGDKGRYLEKYESDSAESISSAETEHYPLFKHPKRPLSTPVMRAPTAMQGHGSGGRDSFREWKQIGLPAKGAHPSGRGSNILMKSSEIPFPRDISTIVDGTYLELQSNLMRFKSLDDLVSSRGHDLDDRRDVRFRLDSQTGDIRDTHHDRRVPTDGHQNSRNKNEYQSWGRRDQAPVKAMTSLFWSQQNQTDTQIWDGMNESSIPSHDGTPAGDYYGGDQEPQSPGRSRKPNSGSRERNSSKGRSEKVVDPKKHVTRHADLEDLSAQPHSVKAKRYKPDDNDVIPKVGHSEPSKRPAHKHGNPMVRSAQGGQISGNDGQQTVQRNLERVRPARYLNPADHQRSLSPSQIKRSASEQSLHTLHFQEVQGHPANSPDITSLVTAYSSNSHFDLRPFSLQEEF